MEDLTKRHCVPCEGGVNPINRTDAMAMLEYHAKDWLLSSDDKSISKKFEFKNFSDALKFVNSVGELAEAEGHHPDIELGWGKVNIFLTTHAINGLSQNDFIMAAKINKI